MSQQPSIHDPHDAPPADPAALTGVISDEEASREDAAFDRMVAQRADLLGEEREAGSADPAEQARVILEDSELRALERELDPTNAGERRTSEETTPPL